MSRFFSRKFYSQHCLEIIISSWDFLIFIQDANYVGTDIPLGHPAAGSAGDMSSAQAVSDRMFRIRDQDNGNRRRVSHVFMTFGQFMDHDFARVMHGPTDACPEK